MTIIAPDTGTTTPLGVQTAIQILTEDRTRREQMTRHLRDLGDVKLQQQIIADLQTITEKLAASLGGAA